MRADLRVIFRGLHTLIEWHISGGINGELAFGNTDLGSEEELLVARCFRKVRGGASEKKNGRIHPHPCNGLVTGLQGDAQAIKECSAHEQCHARIVPQFFAVRVPPFLDVDGAREHVELRSETVVKERVEDKVLGARG